MELAFDSAVRRKAAFHAAIRAPIALAFLGLIVIAPSGTLQYREGWIFLAVLAICSISSLAWLAAHDPELLERRMKLKEKEPEQKRLVKLGWVIAIATFGLPGLDHRFGWSNVPLQLAMVADAVVAGAYLFFIIILRENRWASRVIEVEPDQRVIDSGPYSVVRHPMYAAAIAMYAASPIALGSWWALVPLPLLVWMLVRRIRNEEMVLRRDLPGYGAYADRVRYRLIPRVW